MSTSRTTTTIIRWILRIALPIVVIALAIGVAAMIVRMRPDAKRRPQPPAVLNVQAIRAEARDYQVTLASRGTVQPRTSSTLIPEVSGRVVEVAPGFRDGGFFEEGDLLLRIDPRDYEAAVTTAKAALTEAELAVVQQEVNAQGARTAVTVAESTLSTARLRLREEKLSTQEVQAAIANAAFNLAEAKLLLAEEQARSQQAQRDWDRLERADEPGDLALRKPQLDAARAAVQAAEETLTQRRQDLELIQPRIESAEAAVRAREAELDQRRRDLDLVEPRLVAARATVEARRAELDQRRNNLQRTVIEAPYAGRILNQRVDIGQYVSPGTILAEIYAIDYAEIRLPITNRQLAFVDLPTRYRGETVSAQGPPVTLIATLGENTYTWDGQIVRTEGAIDVQSRQIFAVAQVDDPYGRLQAGRPPLKVGMFVRADIQGDHLREPIVLPRGAVRQGGQVYVIDDQGQVTRRDVDVVWTDEESAVITSGLAAGEIVCLTPVTFAGESVNVSYTLMDEPESSEAQP